jgi:ADP-ribose pyrophosphatase YjhB (NUDIX family)
MDIPENVLPESLECFVRRPLGDSPGAGFHLVLWKEDYRKKLRPVRMDDESCSQALSSLVLVCTDTLIINTKNRQPYVAMRRARPMADRWWFIGGRRLFGETPLAAMVKRFKRETSLSIPAARFKFIGEFEYMFKDRQQKPQSGGNHTLSHTFAVELSPDEIRTAADLLDPEEYYVNRGLVSAFFVDDRGRYALHRMIPEVWKGYMRMKDRGLI